jgi:hypothetical protein
MATPDPSNVAPWYLRNINQALALDETSGNVYVRTDVQIAIALAVAYTATNADLL